ncbi:MAG: hypothetical protein V8R91_02660 [Butyricimonas faecihominis]
MTYLCNPEKNIKVELQHVVRPSFFANGKWLRYTVTAPEADSCACDSTFLLRLRDMKKIYWDREYDFNEYNTSELITYSYPIDKKSPKYRRFVIRNIGNCDSIVMDSVENCTLLRGHKAMVYIKNHGEYKSLCYRPLKGKSVVIFSDKKLLLKDYSLAHDQLGGTFTVASDTSKMNNPDLFYSFSIPKESVGFWWIGMMCNSRKIMFGEVGLIVYPMTESVLSWMGIRFCRYRRKNGKKKILVSS